MTWRMAKRNSVPRHEEDEPVFEDIIERLFLV